MRFEIDKQTLDDLEVFDAFRRENSLFGIFNYTKTIGGKNRLTDMFSCPLSDAESIRERIGAIRFFEEETNRIELDKQSIDFVEHYLSQGNYPTRKKSHFRAIEDVFMYKLKPTEEYYTIERGIDYLVDLLNLLKAFYERLNDDCPPLIDRYKKYFMQAFSKEEFEGFAMIKNLGKISAGRIADFDYVFRYESRDQVRKILDIVYDYDVFMSVAQVRQKRNLAYPDLLPGSMANIDIEGMFHPFLKEPVVNDISMDGKGNMLFLTGPNMAGKSTFLKSLGVVTYLAHVGFPVPAKVAKLSVLNGLSTTMNLSDNLNKHQSFFYAEVLRIKDVANKLKEKKRMLVIFDELFRGTNVKDASDGSYAVISAFSDIKTSFFAVSTHIYEIAERIGKKQSISFRCFLANSRGGVPEYTYKLENGVTEDRLGMYIIEKEKVIETINSINGN